MVNGADLSAPSMRWDVAVKELDDWLSANAGGVRRFGAEAARLHPTRAARDGWRVPIAVGNVERRIDVLVDEAFPFAPPRLLLVDRPKHLTWPHIEVDGHLCILPNGVPTSGRDPVALLQRLLAEAVELIEASESGANAEDFRSEFNSYWEGDAGVPRVRSLLEPRGPSRSIAIHRFQRFYVVAEDKPALRAWLEHDEPGNSRNATDFGRAFLVWLDRPMLPSEYPNNTADVMQLVQRSGLTEEFQQLATGQKDGLVVVFGAQSENGPALCAVILRYHEPGRRAGTSGLTRGFRLGRVPKALVARRFVASLQVSKAEVQRFDAAWIHGRDADPDFPALRAAKVVVVGCGSVGGAVAANLAVAGVGTLDLIDPETMVAANVGRHVLGMPNVGRHKATALAEGIKRNHPQIRRVEAHSERWEVTAGRIPERFDDADLIVSTIGEWAPEASLNAWRIARNRRPNILFGWTEPHAVAGHAVGLIGERGCLACGLTDWGEPLLPVAAWPNEPGQRREPACGVMYQPYGPVELAHITALVAEAAIDVLLSRADAPFHRTWVARQAILDRAGCTWSDPWIRANRGAPRAGCADDRPWHQRQGCLACAAADP